jgi:putative DNA primase/helicase
MAASSTTSLLCTNTRSKKAISGAAFLAAPPHSEGVVALYMKEQTAPNQQLLPVRAESISEELTVRPQWVVWRAVGDKPDKVPYSARTGHRASSTDLLTWSTFQEALETYESGEYAGVGFVFSSADPYTGIDLDNCVDENGEIALWALEIVRYFDSYTELSATGSGLHIIVRGDVPNRRKGDVEVYRSKRFFTVPGHVVEVSGD